MRGVTGPARAVGLHACAPIQRWPSGYLGIERGVRTLENKVFDAPRQRLGDAGNIHSRCLQTGTRQRSPSARPYQTGNHWSHQAALAWLSFDTPLPFPVTVWLA